MGLWAKSLVMCHAIRAYGTQSVRRLAERTGLSTSSVHRHLQAVNRRDRSPESALRETEAGRTWLIRLVTATLFVFGLKRGVGAETRSELFGRLRREAHVGCSPSALRNVLHTLERIILDTAATWEQEGMAHGERRLVIGTVDATFVQRMMLVFMDLTSGSVLREEVAVDRTYDTWYDLVNGRLKTLGTEVLYLVSDRVKALVKLAHTGLGCLSIPDVLHLSHDLAKGSSLAIFSRLRHTTQALAHAKQRLEALAGYPPERDQREQAQALVEACEASVQHWQGVRSAWRQPLSNVSRIMHPWRLVDSTRQTSQEVACQLHAELQALETLHETNGLPVKKAIVAKVRTQLAGLSALVDLWWHTVHQDVEQMAMPPRWTQWADELLLPLQDWQEQRRRTRCPNHKTQIALVLQAVAEVFARHPCPRQLHPEVLAGWNAWAAEHARAFQRASSAVAGRNGYLSQMQHNHRGLPRRRSQVWTVLQNVDGRTADGTPPASRFFRRSVPDLFERVLSQIDELPLPRQRRQALAVSA